MRIIDTVAIVIRATHSVADHLWKCAAMSCGFETVSGYAHRMGADTAWMRRWGGAVGLKVAAAYRKATGHEPFSAMKAKPRAHKRHFAYPKGSEILKAVFSEFAVKSGLGVREN